MRTLTVVNLVKQGIQNNLSNDEIRNLPKLQKLEREHGYVVNDRQIDGLRESLKS